MVLPFGDLLVTGKLTSLFDNLPVLKMVIFSKANSYLALKLPEDIDMNRYSLIIMINYTYNGGIRKFGYPKTGIVFFQCFIGQLTVERVTGFERHNELIPFEHEPPRICLVYCHVILPQDDDPLVCDLWRYPTYPLVNCYIAIEHGHRNSGFSH